MALQYSVAVRNKMLEYVSSSGYERMIALSKDAVIELWSGTVPTTADGAPAGTKLSSDKIAEYSVPDQIFATPSGGAMSLLVLPLEIQATAAGTATFFRIRIGSDSGVDLVLLQGTVGTSGADLIVTSTSFIIGQKLKITSFAITAANA